jgi:hypothetical protein
MIDNITDIPETPAKKPLGGRPPGSLNKSSSHTPKLSKADVKAITRTLVAAAKEGDVSSAALLMAKPAQKERFVRFDMPTITTAAEVKLAQATFLNAVAAGVLTISEAEKLSKLAERLGQSIAEAEFSSHLTKLEKKKGVA